MRGYCGIGLENPKTNINVGSALRACGIFGASFLAVTGGRFKSAQTDTMKHYRHLPFLRPTNLRETLPFDCVPVAVDKIDGAIPLPKYIHPERAFYIFGAEDATLGRKITDWCRDIIYVPMDGCMNLSASVNVILYDRFAKFNQKNKELEV